MNTIRVIIADDHPVMRSGTRRLLESEDDIEVVGEAATGEEAIRLAESKRPDVLVLDMQMPGLSGVEVARQLRQEGASARILALSAHDDLTYVEGLMEIGAAGYVTKEEPPRVIVEAVRAIARGGRRWFVQPPTGEPSAESPLTEREEEVLRLMARGQSNEEIGEALFIAENTVRNHVASVYSKIGASSAREAVAWAWENGLTAEDSSDE